MTTYHDTLVAARVRWARDSTLDALDAMEASERSYSAILGRRQADWDALPDGERKDAAAINADDTQAERVFSADDRVAWLDCALVSYALG